MQVEKSRYEQCLMTARDRLSGLREEDVEQGIIDYVFGTESKDKPVNKVLASLSLPRHIDTIVSLFGKLLDYRQIQAHGIVFTPKYIADYIVSQVFSDLDCWRDDIKILDPGCGCGVFLLSAMEYLNKKFGVSPQELVQNNLYGFDIEPNNVRRCQKILFSVSGTVGNIYCCDALQEDWTNHQLSRVDYIIGNPPYINFHNLAPDTALLLRQSFRTMESGNGNVFYAFIEKSFCNLSNNGRVGFIVPNNFFFIKAATKLRKYLKEEKCLCSILDFRENFVFDSAKTYSCVLLLDKKNPDVLQYAVLQKTGDIQKALENINYSAISKNHLDEYGWKLLSAEEYDNIKRIESQVITLKPLIRGGIATLNDAVFMGAKEVESEILRPIFKVPELKTREILDAKKQIIFPYREKNGKMELILEVEMQEKYPKAYAYLLSQKKLLDARDKGKSNAAGWYAYGRTQGLMQHGSKILFPTFSVSPRFIKIDDPFVLYCNGYAVLESDSLELDVLCRILNSNVMQYYISRTSYLIKGGYYCYQKKYLGKFSIPEFTSQEKEEILKMESQQLNAFLWGKYQLTGEWNVV